jgi:hypothetical protein
MKARKWWILGFLLMALVVAGPALAAPVGKVTHLEGKADLTDPAGKVLDLKVGDPVNNGDILRTKGKTKVGITFTEGNTLWLAEKSRMKISSYNTEEGSSSVFELFRGKSRAVVAKLAKRSTFEVHTPTSVCGVRGTTLISLFLNGESSFFLQGGAGYGYNKSNPSDEKRIPAGSGMVVTDEKAEPVVQPSTAADVEKHMQDTTVGTDSGSTGSSDAGTTLGVAIPWTPQTGTETPPPTPPETPPASTTFSTPVLLGGFSGTLGGSFDPLLGTGTISYSGAGPAGAAATSLDPPLTGILSNGATFTGLLGGVPGSYSGFFNSITNNGGTLGLLAGNLDGTFAGGSIDASGPLTFTNLGYTAAGAFQPFPTITLPTFQNIDLSDLSYDAGVAAGLGYGYPTTSGGVFGLWGSANSGGFYSNPNGITSWSAYYGYDYTNSYTGPTDVYMLGLISGTDDLAGHTTITGNDSIQYMDRNYFGLLSVNYRGAYDGQTYQTAGTGTFKLAPLAFSGEWGGYYGSIFSNDSGYSLAGEDYGLVGGFSLPWLGATKMYAMGGYYTDTAITYSHYIWNTLLYGQARTGQDTWDVNQAFAGYTAGLWIPVANSGGGSIEGAARALFQNLTFNGTTYSGTIGILSADDLRGNYYTFYNETGEGYHEDGMWRAEGTLGPTYSETIANATVSTDSGYSDYPFQFSGAFNNGGYINSVEGWGSTNFFVVNNAARPWGRYNITYYLGEFDRPAGATSWLAYTGGPGSFGDTFGLWVSTVKGTWNDAGEIRGTLGAIAGDSNTFGIYITDKNLGTIGGPFYGVNQVVGSTWIGQSIGTYSGTAITGPGYYGGISIEDYDVYLTQQDYQNYLTKEIVANSGETWVIKASLSAGGYYGGSTATPGAAWTTIMPQGDGEIYMRTTITTGDTSTFTATSAGGTANWAEGWTSVVGSNIKGIFTPYSAWKAATISVGVETGAFLDKVAGMTTDAQRQAFQNVTNIPAFQVGQVNLTGSNENLTISTMNVNFLSSQSGGAPQIWATKDIAGTYNSAPVIGETNVGLYDSTEMITATFTPTYWQSNKWGAKVTGSGTLNSSWDINFKGGAAGAINSLPNGSPGTFSGTGAGVVKATPYLPPG